MPIKEGSEDGDEDASPKEAWKEGVGGVVGPRHVGSSLGGGEDGVGDGSASSLHSPLLNDAISDDPFS